MFVNKNFPQIFKYQSVIHACKSAYVQIDQNQSISHSIFIVDKWRVRVFSLFSQILL